jgi:hypothetical protein
MEVMRWSVTALCVLRTNLAATSVENAFLTLSFAIMILIVDQKIPLTNKNAKENIHSAMQPTNSNVAMADAF